MNKQEALNKIEELKKYVEDCDKKTEVNWRAEKGESYYSFALNGEIVGYANKFDGVDDFNHLIGNYFKTKEEAVRHLEYLKAVGRVTHRINELNEGWKPDWSNNNKGKWYLYYNRTENNFRLEYNSVIQKYFALPYMKTQKIAEQIIKEHKDDLLIIFGKK